MGQRVLGRQKDRAHVDRHHPIPLFDAALFDALYGNDAGVVDDDVHPAKGRYGRGDKGAYFFLTRHVCMHVQRLAARILDGVGCCCT